MFPVNTILLVLEGDIQSDFLLDGHLLRRGTA